MHVNRVKEICRRTNRPLTGIQVLRSQSLAWPTANFSGSLRRSLREQFVPLLAPQSFGWAAVKLYLTPAH
jgi:hypothetical protein